MRAGSQGPPGPGYPDQLLSRLQHKASLSPNFHTSRASRSMAFLKLFVHSCLLVLGSGWPLPKSVKGSPLIQGLEGGSGAVLTPVSGSLPGSEIPGGKTQTRWTEMSKASSSWRPRRQRARRCPRRLGAARPPRSCGDAAGQSRGYLGPSLLEPGAGSWRRASRPWGPRAPSG